MAPPLDPTQNVRELVEAAIVRMDDLRMAGQALADEKIEGLRREAALQAQHAKEMREAETERINAILAASATAVLSAAERATNSAAQLAGQVQGTADTLRTMMASRDAVMGDRVSALERASYEDRGKSAVADPMIAELVAEMKLMRTGAATTSGKFAGADLLWKLLTAALGVVVVVGGFVVALGG